MIEDERARLAALAVAAGYRATVDPRNLNPPGVLIGPARNWTPVGSCAIRANVPVLVVVPPPGNADAMAWASAAAETLFHLLDARGCEPARHQAGGQELPGFELDVPITSTLDAPTVTTPVEVPPPMQEPTIPLASPAFAG